jgi:hypothetical protein
MKILFCLKEMKSLIVIQESNNKNLKFGLLKSKCFGMRELKLKKLNVLKLDNKLNRKVKNLIRVLTTNPTGSSISA